MSLYSQRGVSAQKEEVHAAVKNLDHGLFANSFCKIYPDYLGNNNEFINLMHADGAGTKSILAYLYWKETGDISVWKGIAQDAIVMNLDDLLCVGIYDNIIFNSTIDRNKNLIPGEVLEQIINGSQEFFELVKTFGINIHYLGGETADVGDVVRTIAVNGTMAARWPKSKIISNEKIKAGNVIVGLASFGKASYEKNYNSGIGSNGLTSARHDILEKFYAENYKESFDNNLPGDVVYIGKNRIKDIPAILSPTRTFAPLLKKILENDFDKVFGLIHCSGGGQTKCLKYIPENVRVIKDNLFAPPEIFKKIQEASKADNREMYQVFNMGCRMEIYTDEDFAKNIVVLASGFNIDAQIIGRVEESEKKELVIEADGNKLLF
ncbi:phosphoribosylformylglycinamidine cyclo-ligase [Hanamia caeni]|uniref:Phosphoribosylformylglycinamidine cyclo-ligase n=1 Tax=Hanamia caeni TaxID=2294116 RepID=A0A3M9NI23_9BACT|nr:AIR synthase related protein [Hanamia caeni]RNI36608.1 phosphoribosylformylglycinamidine cyclo-ligase [Hanamia caeni]